jgi:hypothetical protein
MNQENRDRVNKYLNSNYVDSLSPLYFNGYESPKDEFDPDKHSVEAMCKRMLQLTRSYPSFDEDTKELECSSGRNRSSLDVWRHIRYYYPQITIYDVMNALYNIDEENDGYYGFFCGNIKRRIFKMGVGHRTVENQDWQRNFNRSGVFDRNNLDEYELFWNDWKDI